MKRTAFVIRLKQGMKEEYKKRHDNIWPELKELTTRRGIRNYSIWYYNEDLLFAYYETDSEGAKPLVSDDEITLSALWEEYMSDIIETVKEPGTGETMNLECLFLHE